MLQTISNFFDSLWDKIVMLIGLLGKTISGFIKIFKLFIPIERLFTRAELALPDVVLAFVAITVTITITYLIIGRATGSSD